MPFRLPSRRLHTAVAGILVLATAATLHAAPKPEPIAVVAIDPYADIRSQLTWVGEQVGNPSLAGFAESFILLATQGKGLAGLDVKRPVGLVITTAGGPLPTAHAFVPVKDLDKLLGAIQGMTGPVEEVNGVRRISPPGGMPLEIADRNGWAILSQPGSRCEIEDPLAVIDPLSTEYSLAVQFFPSRMPAEMRDRLKALVEEAALNAAARGQPIDDAAFRAGLERFDEIETLLFGLAIDTDADDVHLDITSVLEPAAADAAMWKEARQAASTIPSPATANGKPAAYRGHLVFNVPAEGRAAVTEGLGRALDQADDDPAVAVVASLIRDLMASMLDAGTIDAGLTVDTSAADGASPLPAVTVGMKVKDGNALQAKVKERLGKAGALPPQVKVAFDTGKEGAATLHEIAIATPPDSSARTRLGESVKLTLAVTPDRAFLLAGGDVKKRLAAALAAIPAADATPFAGAEASLAAAIGYAATMMKAFSPDDPQGELLGDVAAQAAEKKSTDVRLSVKPVERGLTIRLSADAGALQTIAASTSMQQPPQPRVREAVPLRPAQPRPQPERAAPALSP